MFSAKNMAKLAKNIFSCEAEKVTASSTPLTDLEKLLQLIGFEQKIIMVPYDSDADQWPCTRKGERAHWGLGTVLNNLSIITTVTSIYRLHILKYITGSPI